MKVPREAVPAPLWQALGAGAVVYARTGVARFRLTGPGRITCLQGLVTADVEQSADGTALFGALLTPKGMIVAPLWITRLVDALVVELAESAAPRVAEIFAKSLPPRLCRYDDISRSTTGLGLYGPRAAELAPGMALPGVVRGASGLEWLATASDAPGQVEALAGRGAVRGTDALFEAARILAGIPRLGSEIDEKTLPQEAGLERLGAVSYTKGCYVGQETVARLHFRGRANRGLALLLADREPAPPDPVRRGDAVVGQASSAAWSDELDAWVALAILRREVADGDEVALASGGSAVVRRERWPREP